MELNGSFQTYVSSIEPDDNAVSNAKAAHEKVREKLKSDEETKDAHKDTFLSGSYARHTAIHNINDVDVICVVDIDHTITEPEVVLSWLKGVLSKYYSETRLQGRSIGSERSQRDVAGHCSGDADVCGRRTAMDSGPRRQGVGAGPSEVPDRGFNVAEQGHRRILCPYG